MERAELEMMLGECLSLAEIGRRVGRHESTVSYWLKVHGLRSIGVKRHAGRGGLDRDRLSELVEQGMSIAELAQELGRSKATVRHWLQRYGLRTHNSSGRRRSRVSLAGIESGSRVVVMECPRHDLAEFVIDGRGYYRCRRCRAESVSRRRRKVKETLVAEAGGACVRCGYSASMGALQFHHRDPATKRMELNARGAALALETLRAEAQKCILLCSNCHAEVEAGAELPMT